MTRMNQIASRWLGGLSVSVLVSLLSACGGAPEESSLGVSEAALSGGAAPSAMIVYGAQDQVDMSKLSRLGRPEQLGGTVLSGSPELSGRIDYSSGGMTAGLFKATTGVVRIVFPFSEHATILQGEVTLTDETGQTHTFRKGDSYFIRQGQVIRWEVRGKYVLKSFFNYSEPAPATASP